MHLILQQSIFVCFSCEHDNHITQAIVKLKCIKLMYYEMGQTQHAPPPYVEIVGSRSTQHSHIPRIQHTFHLVVSQLIHCTINESFAKYEQSNKHRKRRKKGYPKKALTPIQVDK